MRELCLFRCEGKPIQQGSMNVSRSGHMYHAKGALLTSYRRALGDAAREQLPDDYAPIDGPVRVTALFVFESSNSKRWGQHKVTAPDDDKLMRSVGDALTKIVYTDDSRIVDWRAAKVWGAESYTVVRCELLNADDEEELTSWMQLTR